MNQTIRQIPLDKIIANTWQTRRGDPDLAYIQSLALDIVANGLLQIPIGRMLDDKGASVGAVQIEAHGGEIAYLADSPGAVVQLAFGHNRLAAYRWLYDLRDNSNIPGDWSAMPVDVRALTDEQLAGFAWSENEKRRDVTAIERARAIQQRLDSFKWTNRACAEALGVDHSTISHLLRLLKLPDDLQQAILEGKISERQAQAILPVFEAPTAVVDKSVGYYYYSSSPEAIKKAALSGESSDELRRKVDSFFSYGSKDLAAAEFKLDQLFPEGKGIYCGLCKICDRRMASRNRCFDSDCFNVKTKLLHQAYLAEASKASGYPPIDEHKDAPTTSLPYDKEKRDRIIATGCPNLRLEYTLSESEYCLIDGYPHAKLVCDKRNGSCTCIKGLAMLASLGSSQSKGQALAQVFDEDTTGTSFQEGDNDDYDADDVREDIAESDNSDHADAVQIPATLSAEELEGAARQARRDKKAAFDQMPEVLEQLKEHLYQALAVDESTGVLFVIAHNSVWPYGNDLDRDHLYRYIAKLAAQKILPSSADSLDDLLKSINRLLGNLKLDPLVIDEAEAA